MPMSYVGNRCPTGEGRDETGPSSRYEGRVFQLLHHCAQEKRWLRQILSLRILNWAFHKLPFKMLTQKCIFGCICLRDWSAAVDQKDLYFHLSILLHHRPFLRVAFKGRAYLCKYAFPPVSLLAQTLCKIREDENQILLVAPCWPTLTWFPELRLLVISPLQQIPLR